MNNVSEASISKQIWLSLSRMCTLFRHNVGIAYIGDRPISVGLALANTKPVKGVSDLIGYTSIEVTKEMIGKKIAIFTSIEVKNSSGGKKSLAQKQWIANIENAGGIAGFASSPEQAENLIQNYFIGEVTWLRSQNKK